jgi:prophage tail length tape measure protein|nr:MAG TPA: minor tail protein [Caudoviricetes sp.]
MASVELATGYYQLVPSMKGNKEAIVGEITGAVTEASDKAGKEGGARLSTRFAEGLKGSSLAAIGAGMAAGIGAALYKVGETFDEVTDTIRTGTGATGEVLDGLVEVAKRVGSTTPAEFSKIAPVVADLNTRLGLTGEDLETVAKQVLEAGRLLGQDVDISKVTAAFNAFGLEAKQIPGAMDDLFRVSQATGLGFNDLAQKTAQAAPTMKALGFGFQDTAAMIGAFDKAGLNSSQIMTSMTKGLTTLAKSGEEPKEAFKRVTGEIGSYIQSGNEAAALKLASKLFGTKGATQFVEALKQGKIGAEDMMKSIGATDDTILGVAGETSDFAEKWQIVQNNAQLALEPLGSAVFSTLADVLSAMAPTLQDIGNWLKENTWAFGALGAAIAGILIPAFVTWVAGIWASTAALLASPITWIVVGIAALAAGLVLLIANWQAVSDFIGGVWNATVEGAGHLWEDFVRGLTEFATGIGQWFMEGLAGAGQQISEFFAGLPQMILDGLAALGQIGLEILAFSMGINANLIEGFVQFLGYIPGWIASVGEWVASLPGKIMEWLSGLNQLVDRAADWFGGFLNGMVRKGAEIIEWCRQLPGKIIGGISSLASSLASTASNAWNGFLRATSDLGGRAIGFVGSLPGKILGALGDLGSLLVRSGGALVDGFLRGIQGAWNTLVGWVKQGMDWLRGLWPFSPAKWGPFSGKGYVTHSGKAIIRDFADSLKDEQPYLLDSAKSVMGDFQSNFQPSLNGVQPAYAGANAGGNASRVNVNAYSSDPYATAEEVARQLRRLM